MSRKFSASYPLIAEACSSPVPQEDGPKIEGCGKEGCGAWGVGVCRVTVTVGEEITTETPPIYEYTTTILATGCMACDMHGVQMNLIEGISGTIPVGGTETSDDDLLFAVEGLILPSANLVIQTKTQLDAELQA